MDRSINPVPQYNFAVSGYSFYGNFRTPQLEMLLMRSLNKTIVIRPDNLENSRWDFSAVSESRIALGLPLKPNEKLQFHNFIIPKSWN